MNGVHTTNFNFVSNGTWYGSYVETQAIDIDIPAGATLTLQRDDDDKGLNIDYIVLSSQ